MPASIGPARAETKIRFSLDWIPGSVHSPFFIAFYKGYYKAEGLDVVIDRGKGSVGLVQQMASGVYDMGYPDISVVEDFNSKNPGKGFPLVMMGYEQAPAGIVFLKTSKITKPKELEGRSLGAAASDGGFKLFPIFARHARHRYRQGKHPISSIRSCARLCWQNARSMRSSGRFSIRCSNSKPRASTETTSGRSCTGIMVSISMATVSPHRRHSSRNILTPSKAFIRATMKGVQDMVKDPEMAVQMALKYEPLLNADIERDRLKLAMRCCIVTPNVLKDGFGDVDAARLQRGIESSSRVTDFRASRSPPRCSTRHICPPRRIGW